MGFVAPVAGVAPFPGNGGGAGLSQRRILDLAHWYIEGAYAQR